MNNSAQETRPWRQYICRACGLIYDEEIGDPDSGLAPGTRFEDIPNDWECPLCGVTKTDFELFEKPEITAIEQTVQFNRQPGIIVVGGGLAGWSSVEAIRQLDPEVPITLVTGCPGDLYHKPELSVALSRGLNTEKLIQERGQDAARRLGVRLLPDTFVIGLTPALHQLRTTRGTLHYTKLVLAQGAKPALPTELPPSLCWRVNDLLSWSGMHKALEKGPQSIAIIGAGMVGCELAEDFVRAGHSVTLLDRNNYPLANLLPDTAGRRLLDNLEKLGVRYTGDACVTSVAERSNGKRIICLEKGPALEVDQIVAATGLITDNRLALQAGLEFDRGIKVDPHTLRTSDEHIYALGDCINLEGTPCRFIEPIAHQAQAIAHDLLGQNTHPYKHTMPVIRLKTRSMPVVLHGLPSPEGQWQVVSQDDYTLVMEQWVNDQAVAKLELGSSIQSQAA